MRRTILLIAVIIALFISYSASAQEDLSKLVAEARPAVVTLAVFDSTGRPIGQGSGFFIDAEHLVTCYHVVQGAERVEIHTSDGNRILSTGICGDDPVADLAVLFLPTARGPGRWLRLDTSNAQIGQRVAAIGSPMGLELTVSDGIVSSYRDMPYIGRVMQITAPVSEGSSGGPILTMAGEATGIATAVYKEGQNLNFATPIARVRALKLGKPISFTEWRRSPPAPHAAVPAIPENAPEFMKDPAMAKFMSDYAFGRGMDMMNHRDLESAVEMFREAAITRPDRADAYYQGGMCEMLMKHYDQAALVFRAGVAVAPGHVNMQYRLGHSLRGAGYPKEAVAPLREAVRLDSTFQPGWAELGDCYVDLKDDANAITSLERAIRLQPGDAFAHHLLGYVLGRQGKNERAERELRESLRLDSTLADSYAALGQVYYQQDRFKEAVPLLQLAARLFPEDAQVQQMFAASLVRVDRCRDAEQILLPLLKANPENSDAHLTLGEVYGCLKREKDAMTQYKEAIRTSPDSPRPHYMLGLIYAARSEKSAALEEYKMLQKSDAGLARALFGVIYK